LGVGLGGISGGAITGSSLAVSGAITGSSLSVSGALSGASLAVSGAMTGASLSVSGALSGASLAVSGAMTGASLSVTGALSGASLSVSGSAAVGSLTIGSGTTITKHLSVTSAQNLAAPGGVPGCVETSAIAVAGAALGDTVVASMSVALPADYTINGYVSSAGFVTVRLCQVASGAADPDGAGATYRVDVWQH